MDRGVFKAILLAVVLVGLVILTVAIYFPFLVAMLWAAVLVTATYPIQRALTKKLGGRRTLAAALMTAALVLTLLLPFVLLAPQFIEEAQYAASRFGEVERVIQEKIAEEGSVPYRIDRWIRESFRNLDSAKLLDSGKFAIGLARETVQAIFSTLATLLFLVIAMFYFFRDGDDAVGLARQLMPLREEDCDLVVADMRNAVNAAVRGGLLTAVIQGALGGAIVALLDLPGAVFWGAVMALASLIPLVGTALVWVPMATFLVWQGHPWKAAILAGYGVAVIGTADNLVRPWLVGQHMRAHPMLLFFGILGSIALFGFKGIVLGPVVVASLTATTTLFRREFSGEGAREATGDPG